MNVLAFDIETVPDVDSGRRLYGLDGLDDADVARAMFH
ncbi:MAG TPA: 3'-5' exonuclease, partial [Gammaproteobacteria bacterium]|nr:3'-5' exonuclease [Gammaproteobacteria bacterium]